MKGYLAVIALLSLLAVAGTSAAWSWLPYFNAYNLTVPNWNYTGSAGFHYPAGYVLVTIHNASTTLLATRGYGNAQNNMGSIPYWVVSQSANTVVLLLANHTNETSPLSPLGRWTNATIFFNPKPNLSTVLLAYSSSVPSQFNAYPIAYSQLVGNYTGLQLGTAPVIGPGGQTLKVFGSVGPINSSISVYSGFINNLNASSVNSVAYARINFTLGQSCFNCLPPQGNFQGSASNLVPQAFVLLANDSLASRYFGIQWNPTWYQTFGVTGQGGRYLLQTKGIFPNYVSNATIPSANANTVFQGRTDGTGFEAWFSTVGNIIATEGMGTIPNKGVIYNSISPPTVGITTNLFTRADYFNLTVDTNTPTTYYVMPAFTTNYTVSSQLFNTTQSPSSNCVPATWFCYIHRFNVTNIQWTYNYKSNATFNVPFHADVNYVPYAQISIPHYSEMGTGCDDIYVNAYNNITRVSEPINYYVKNCSSNYALPITLLIPNVSTNGYYDFNSLSVYFDSGIFGSLGVSNSVVLNQWRFQTGNSLDYEYLNSSPGNPAYLPFLDILSQPLNPTSYINMQNLGGFDISQIFETGNKYILGPGSPPGEVNDIYAATQFVIAVTNHGNNFDMLSRNLYYNDTGHVGNCKASNLTLTNGGFPCGFQELVTHMTGGGTASYEYLFTTNYTNGTVSTFSTPVLSNGTPPGIPITVPATPTSGNTTNTPTLNFNGILTNVVAIGDTGVSLPGVVLDALQILLMLLAFAAMEEEYSMPAIGMLAVMWIIGVFRFQLLAIAIIGTLMVIVEHFIMEERRRRRGPMHVGLPQLGEI